MRIYGPDSTPPPRLAPVATLGVFDGVHLGHARVAGETVAWARDEGAPSLAITFDPHPRALVGQAPPAIGGLDQRIDLLARLGLDAVWIMRFDRDLADEPAEAFAQRIFAGALAARGVVLGHSARFGRDRRGEATLLAKWAAPWGMAVRAVAPVCVDGAAVSSSRVREAMRAGRLEEVRRLLGRDFATRGAVVAGRAIARGLGLPTLNLGLPDGRLRPPLGVYAGRVRLWRPEDDGADGAEADGGARRRVESYGAVINVGPQPGRVYEEGRDPVSLVEAHAFGLRGDRYGWTAEVSFLGWLRAPTRFGGIDEARLRLLEDARAARAFLGDGW